MLATMKGARDVKGVSGKSNQHKGGLPASEAEPLFPRVHVNETEKAGPRAPPRNKMALYEQFTIPSHRYVPSHGSSSSSGTSPYKQQGHCVSNEYRYAYPSYYMPSTLPYANSNFGAHTYAHPSFGVSSGSAVVEKSVPSVVSKTVVTAGTDNRGKNVSDKKARNDIDFHVPTLSTHRVQDKVSGKATSPVKRCGSSISHTHKSVVDGSIVDNPQEIPSACKPGSVCLSQTSGSLGGQRAGADGRSLFHVVDEGQTSKILEPRTADWYTKSLWQPCQQVLSCDAGSLPESGAICQGRPSSVHSTSEAGTSSQCTGAGECTSIAGDELDSVKAVSCDLSSPAPKNSVLSMCNPEGLLLSKEDVEVLRLHKHSPGSNQAQKGSPPVAEGNEEAKAAPPQLHHENRNRCEGSGESGNPSTGNGEILEPSQHGTGNGSVSEASDLSMLDSVSALSISPTDVVRAVGQQQFWKARRAIIRQQKIFSDQVFELHKLIKVQKLLAETPNIFIDEEIYFGTAADSPECGIVHFNADGAADQNHGEEQAHRSASVLREMSTGPSLEAGFLGGLPFNPGRSYIPSTNPDGQIYRGTYPSGPAVIPGGTSVWGYPSLGGGQWIQPMAAHAGSFMYQPGSFPSGSPFTGAHGSAILGPVAPVGIPSMVSFSLPCYDQRTELAPDMHSRYGHAVPSTHHWHSVLSHNPSVGPIAPSFPGSWHPIQHNHYNYIQRSPCIGTGEEAPSGSVASITNKPETSTHTIQTSSVPGMQCQWGMNGRTGQSAKQSAHTPIIALRERPGYGHQDEQGWAQTLNLGGAYHSADLDHCDNDGASSLGEKDADRKAARWPKRHKEGAQTFVSSGVSDEEMDIDISPDHSANALSLFPLVPSLDSVEPWERPARQAEDWQGQVIKVVPHPAVAASESAAGILLCLQQERHQ